MTIARPTTRRPAAANDAPPLDAEAALSRCLGDGAFLLTTLENFAEEMPRHIQQIERGVQSRQAATVRENAHAMKGSAGLIAAQRLSELAAEMEDLGATSTLEASLPVLNSLREEFARCMDFIAEFRRSHQEPAPKRDHADSGSHGG